MQFSSYKLIQHDQEGIDYNEKRDNCKGEFGCFSSPFLLVSSYSDWNLQDF